MDKLKDLESRVESCMMVVNDWCEADLKTISIEKVLLMLKPLFQYKEEKK